MPFKYVFMVFVGSLLQEVVKARKKIVDRTIKPHFNLQEKLLRKFVTKARKTIFGQHYNFDAMLNAKHFIETFQHTVPIFTYETMHELWWHNLRYDKEDISWPGRVKYMALTSGTSQSSSKRIPITQDMIHSIRQTSIRQLLTLPDLNIDKEFYQKSVLLLGGSTALTRVNNHFEGDLTGIMASRLPVWFYKFYKPGKKIADIREWEHKLNAIVAKAPYWDIGAISGVPAWVQLLIEKVIDYHKVRHIHDIWPNFSIYVHGGVALEPYKKNFSNLLGHELTYMDTYLASEGFMAFQKATSKTGMKLVLDKGVFFEFIPFNDDNFDTLGKPRANPEVVTVNDLKQGKEYAPVITTCAGTWRYLIGDTIKLTSSENYEIRITGRITHFLSLCGEHLSVANMNKAIADIEREFHIDIKEFTVCGIHYENLFAHHWYIGVDKKTDEEKLNVRLDHYLKKYNDDYKTERKAALKDIFITTLPNSVFYEWMKKNGKTGGQHKFPRVLKGEQLNDWKAFIDSQNLL